MGVNLSRLVAIQNGVLNPDALMIHQPALASKMVKAPPNVTALRMYHQVVDSNTSKKMSVPITAANRSEAIPIFNRYAFPLASILHCILSSPLILICCQFCFYF